MKIFFASQSFYPHIGGVSTYLLNLAKGLLQRGDEVTEVHLRPPYEASEDIIEGIKVFRIPKEPLNNNLLKGYSNFKERVYRECHGEGDLFSTKPLVSYGYDEYNSINMSIGDQIEELLEKNPTEIVHIHDFQLLLIYRNIPRGIPIILTWHIPFADSISKNLKQFLVKHMNEYDKVIFSCWDYASSAIKAGLSAQKVKIIPPIANTELFRPKEACTKIKDLYHIPEKSKIILCVQRIDSKSGHIQLIRAMPKVVEKFPDARLVFIGGESMTSKISDERQKYVSEVYSLIEKFNLKDNVVFTGNVEYNLLPDYYNSADIVALTSKNEGFGLAVSEGMACGKPIIGTKVPGIAAQVKDGLNGYLVDAGDSESTAERIIKLLGSEELRKNMGEESLRIIKDKFEISKGIDSHCHLYRSLIKEKTDWCLEKLKLDDVSAIITDFDRTITSSTGEVDEQLLKELDALNKPLILVTGRRIDYVKSLYEKYPVWDCIIGENGSYIYFPADDLSLIFDSDKLQKAKEMLVENNISSNNGHSIISVSKEDELKVKETLMGLKDSLSFKDNIDEMMVTPKGVGKGLTVKLALNHLGIDLKKAIIIGDGENDIDLFTLPGFKIAVANAVDSLKVLADEVTKKPSAQGVLEAIAKLRL
ncbi:MAG TPA: glycosyltransferase [Candidatus Nanoarchaeia archaeon]|nr:glycosyltransferase [Candidatus Nanoarchaeia archaeon]